LYNCLCLELSFCPKPKLGAADLLFSTFPVR
jgi:hypothetical protein